MPGIMAKSRMPEGRNASLDLIRVISMIFVIAVHTSPKPMARSALFTAAFSMVLLTCNSNFYMLSGELNLTKRVETAEDYRSYFLGKGISVLFPYVFVTCLLTLWNLLESGTDITVSLYFSKLYTDFMADNNKTHLWFMFPLTGMLLSAPFLSKMVNSMKEAELHVMFGIGILWGIISIYLSEDLGVGFAYSNWLWGGWSLTFFAGYYGSQVIKSDNKRKWYFLGLICFGINLLGSWLFPGHNKFSTDLAPAFLIFSMTGYAFLKNEIKIKSEPLKRLIFFLAKHSFTVYMIHYYMISSFTMRILKPVKPSVYFCLSVLITFAASLTAAVILDMYVINPIQNLLRRKLL